MKTKISAYLTIFCLLVCPAAHAEDRLKVAATLAPYADIVKSIGGDRVDVFSVAAPRFNPHFIEPKPTDVLRVKRSDLFVASGLDLEAWMMPLLDAAAKPELRPGGARFLSLAAGIPLLEVPQGVPSRSQGDIHLYGNPHAWMSPENGLIMARLIAAKLAELDLAGAAAYQTNLKNFENSLTVKISEWRDLVSAQKGSELIGYHNEWIYLVDFLGLKMEQFLEPKPGIPPTPGQLQQLREYIPAHKIRAIVQPTYYPDEASNSLGTSSGIPVLLLCQQVGEKPECGDYISMIDFDVKSIASALNQSKGE